MSILGIDEAGRGPVIGPLVIAGVLIPGEKALEGIPVKDSKLLTPKRREELAAEIRKHTKVFVRILQPKDIDRALKSPDTNLNWLEADNAASIADEARANILYMDCPSTNIARFTDYLQRKIKAKANIVAEHKADATYPVVSAASIIAKVTRDGEIEKIKRKYGIEFGSGYPSDPLTQEFLRKHFRDYPIFRTSWASYLAAAETTKQTTLR